MPAARIAIQRRSALTLLLGSLMALPGGGGASAQGAPDAAANYPSRNITLVVPGAPGGPPDALARIVAAELGKALGRTVVVENRPGGSTGLASQTVARAVPDGYTLMTIDISHAVTPHIATNMGVDLLTDFRMIGQTAKSVFTLIASPALGTPTVTDFIRLAREKPDVVKVGHTGIGTTPHLAALVFMKSTGIDPMLIPYRGVHDAVGNMLGGHISAVFSAATTAIGLAPGGQVALLGVTGDTRMAKLPTVPTFAESGIAMPGLENGSWYGLAAPARTPDAIVRKINAAWQKMAQDERLRAHLAASGLELTGGSPEAFQTFFTAQYKYWGETLRAAGVARP
jgi:tripartite-type tricarboxylate transporter receptor subunit TctC